MKPIILASAHSEPAGIVPMRSRFAASRQSARSISALRNS
jgi:hypothetical protein